MALSKTTTFKGVTISNAYHRVWGVTITTDAVSFGIGVHASADAEMIDSTSHTCSYNIAGSNPIQQAYEHLKTLTEFSGATDV
tara:strand:- start:56 stop:304 length:249 start_codon:yes stop_codon:yes gene_type:complete